VAIVPAIGAASAMPFVALMNSVTARYRTLRYQTVCCPTPEATPAAPQLGAASPAGDAPGGVRLGRALAAVVPAIGAASAARTAPGGRSSAARWWRWCRRLCGRHRCAETATLGLFDIKQSAA